jgi:hypothetical protein
MPPRETHLSVPRYCAVSPIQRKTAHPNWKVVLLPVLNHDSGKLSNRKHDGRNGDPAMTKSVTSQMATGGFSARFCARNASGLRPLLGSSHALLLLLSCP